MTPNDNGDEEAPKELLDGMGKIMAKADHLEENFKNPDRYMSIQNASKSAVCLH